MKEKLVKDKIERELIGTALESGIMLARISDNEVIIFCHESVPYFPALKDKTSFLKDKNKVESLKIIGKNYIVQPGWPEGSFEHWVKDPKFAIHIIITAQFDINLNINYRDLTNDLINLWENVSLFDNQSEYSLSLVKLDSLSAP